MATEMYEYKIVDETKNPAVVVSQGKGKQIQIDKARNKYSSYATPDLAVYRRLPSKSKTWTKIETVKGK